MKDRLWQFVLGEVLALAGLMALPTALGVMLIQAAGGGLITVPVGAVLALCWACGIAWVVRDVRRRLSA